VKEMSISVIFDQVTNMITRSH